MKVIIVALSVIVAVTTALPQQGYGAEKMFETFSSLFQAENLHQILTVVGGDYKSDKLCSMCEKSVSTLDSFLSDANVQTKLSSALAVGCNKITDQNKQQSCTKLITKDFPMLLETITKLINPTTICVKMFKTCPNPSPSKTDLANYGNPFVPKVIDDLECAACFAGFGFIEQAFLNNDFASFCTEQIQPVCDFLTDAEKHQKCLDTVTKVVGEIFQSLRKHADPRSLCIGTAADPAKIPNTGCPVKSYYMKNKL